jgi:hypothetical protein
VVSKVGDIAKWGTYNAKRSERGMRGGCGISIAARDPDMPVLDRYLTERGCSAEMVDKGRINLCSVAWILNAASRHAAVACFHRRLGREVQRIPERRGVA